MTATTTKSTTYKEAGMYRFVLRFSRLLQGGCLDGVITNESLRFCTEADARRWLDAVKFPIVDYRIETL